jgi:hypothetical protein
MQIWGLFDIVFIVALMSNLHENKGLIYIIFYNDICG